MLDDIGVAQARQDLALGADALVLGLVRGDLEHQVFVCPVGADQEGDGGGAAAQASEHGEAAVQPVAFARDRGVDGGLGGLGRSARPRPGPGTPGTHRRWRCGC